MAKSYCYNKMVLIDFSVYIGVYYNKCSKRKHYIFATSTFNKKQCASFSKFVFPISSINMILAPIKTSLFSYVCYLWEFNHCYSCICYNGYLKYAAQVVFYTNPFGNVLHMCFVGTWVRKRSYISKTGKRFNDSLLKY